MRGMHKLSAAKVAKTNRPGMYGDGGGLWLQVSDSGKGYVTKSWLYRFMMHGRARTMGLGSVDRFGLAEARERARNCRQLVADGIDPIEARQSQRDVARADAAKRVTFQDAAEKYIAAHNAGWRNAKHADQWRATLATYAYPTIGPLAVDDIETGHVTKVVEPI